MSVLIEVGRWIRPHLREELFGWVIHLGFISLCVTRGRMSDRWFAFRTKLEEAAQS
jgi:hypothetical protein